MLLKRVYIYIKQSLSPSFLIFFAIAFVIWSLNRLGGEFSGVSEVPISISGRKDSIFFDSSREYMALCNIKSKGFSHLLNSLRGYPSAIEIPASELSLAAHPSQSGYYYIDIKSLENALSPRLDGETLTSIVDNSIIIGGEKYSEKRVEVRSQTSIDLGGLYMQVGGTHLDPQMVTIYGQRSVIDTIDYILADKITVSNPYSDIKGRVNIADDKLYSVKPREVNYSIDVEQYAEVNFNTSVEVFVNRDSVATASYELLPAKVKVKCNVARSLYHDFSWDSIVLYVNMSDRDSNGNGYGGHDHYRVEVLSSSIGVDVVDISPKYITVLKRGV